MKTVIFHNFDGDESSGDRDYKRSSGDIRRDGSRKRKRTEEGGGEEVVVNETRRNQKNIG